MRGAFQPILTIIRMCEFFFQRVTSQLGKPSLEPELSFGCCSFLPPCFAPNERDFFVWKPEMNIYGLEPSVERSADRYDLRHAQKKKTHSHLYGQSTEIILPRSKHGSGTFDLRSGRVS